MNKIIKEKVTNCRYCKFYSKLYKTVKDYGLNEDKNDYSDYCNKMNQTIHIIGNFPENCPLEEE